MSTTELALTRREFVVTAVALTVCRSRETSAPGDVVIVEFSESGERGNTVRVPKVVKSLAEGESSLALVEVGEHERAWLVASADTVAMLMYSACGKSAKRTELYSVL